eukprot:m51a1_g655 hypothetical protein (472) ;mRNA; r:222021-223674
MEHLWHQFVEHLARCELGLDDLTEEDARDIITAELGISKPSERVYILSCFKNVADPAPSSSGPSRRDDTARFRTAAAAGPKLPATAYDTRWRADEDVRQYREREAARARALSEAQMRAELEARRLADEDMRQLKERRRASLGCTSLSSRYSSTTSSSSSSSSTGPDARGRRDAARGYSVERCHLDNFTYSFEESVEKTSTFVFVHTARACWAGVGNSDGPVLEFARRGARYPEPNDVAVLEEMWGAAFAEMGQEPCFCDAVVAFDVLPTVAARREMVEALVGRMRVRRLFVGLNAHMTFFAIDELDGNFTGLVVQVDDEAVQIVPVYDGVPVRGHSQAYARPASLTEGDDALHERCWDAVQKLDEFLQQDLLRSVWVVGDPLNVEHCGVNCQDMQKKLLERWRTSQILWNGRYVGATHCAKLVQVFRFKQQRHPQWTGAAKFSEFSDHSCWISQEDCEDVEEDDYPHHQIY